MIFAYYAMLASFLGTGVECVEALTVVLAVGITRGWKISLSGALAAIFLLAILVGTIGTSLTLAVHLFWVQLFVGLFMLLFGIRWLRKAILRYAGIISLHNEANKYQNELERQQKVIEVNHKFDSFGFMTTLSGTFLEGLEAIFIVITLGTSSTHSGLMSGTIIGAMTAGITVSVIGILLKNPLTRIPENTMKFIVGIMMTSFGAFWVGEAFHVAWPQSDSSIIYISLTLVLFSWILVKYSKRKLHNGGRTNESPVVSVGINR